MPPRVFPTVFGLDHNDVPSDFFRQLVHPFLPRTKPPEYAAPEAARAASADNWE